MFWFDLWNWLSKVKLIKIDGLKSLFFFERNYLWIRDALCLVWWAICINFMSLNMMIDELKGGNQHLRHLTEISWNRPVWRQKKSRRLPITLVTFENASSNQDSLFVTFRAEYNDIKVVWKHLCVGTMWQVFGQCDRFSTTPPEICWIPLSSKNA